MMKFFITMYHSSSLMTSFKKLKHLSNLTFLLRLFLKEILTMFQFLVKWKVSHIKFLISLIEVKIMFLVNSRRIIPKLKHQNFLKMKIKKNKIKKKKILNLKTNKIVMTKQKISLKIILRLSLLWFLKIKNCYNKRFGREN